MPDLEALVSAAPEWSRNLERAVFGLDFPAAVAERIGSFVGEHLGPVEEALFYSVGVGIVVGVRLLDGRAVVLKVHRHNASTARLAAIHRVQQHLADRGLPAPRPLLGPTALDGGIATVEEHRPAYTADGHDPDVRSSLARHLWACVEAAADVGEVADIGRATAIAEVADGGDGLWGEPHDLRFDFPGTAAGAEWIDELGRLARVRLAGVGDEGAVTGHLDWRVENLGFDGSEVVAIYDFDSLALAPEAVIVGQAAAGFSTDWRTGPASMPDLDEMASFVRDYEAARGRAFDARERDALDAANLYLCAYGARCQHSDQVRFAVVPDGPVGWVRLLEARGESGLLDRL